MRTSSRGMAAAVGAGRLISSPVPSWPNSFEPQQKTAPDSSTDAAWSHPQSMYFTRKRSRTSSRVGGSGLAEWIEL